MRRGCAQNDNRVSVSTQTMQIQKGKFSELHLQGANEGVETKNVVRKSMVSRVRNKSYARKGLELTRIDSRNNLAERGKASSGVGLAYE